MSETIGAVIVLLLALYGCASVIWDILRLIYKPRARDAGMYVIPISGHREDVEYVIRGAAYHAEGRVLIVDAGMDDETRELTKQVCARLHTADFYTHIDLDSILEQSPAIFQ